MRTSILIFFAIALVVTLVLFVRSKDKTFFGILLLLLLIPVGRSGVLSFINISIIGQRSFIPMIGGAILLLLFVEQIALRKQMINVTKHGYPLIISYIVLAALSAATNPGIPANLNSVFTYIQCVILMFLIVELSSTPQHLIKIGWVLIVSICFLSTVMILQKKGLLAVASFEERATVSEMSRTMSWERSASSLGDANFTALHLNIAIPFLLYYLFMYKSIILRGLLLGATAIVLIALTFCVSMGGMLGLLISLLLIIVFPPTSKSRGRLAIFTMVLLSLFVLKAVNDPSIVSRVKYKLSRSSVGDVTGATSGRNITLISGIKAAIHHPIIGCGVSNLTIQIGKYSGTKGARFGPHNLFFYIAVEAGLIAAFLFIIFTFKVLLNILKSLIKKQEINNVSMRIIGNILIVCLIAFLIQSMFISSPKIKYLWILMGMGISFSNLISIHKKG